MNGYDWLQRWNAVSDPCTVACHPEVPYTYLPISTACADDVMVRWIPCDALDRTSVSLKQLQCALRFNGRNPRVLVPGCCCEHGVIQTPFHIEYTIFVGLKSRSLRFYGW